MIDHKQIDLDAIDAKIKKSGRGQHLHTLETLQRNKIPKSVPNPEPTTEKPGTVYEKPVATTEILRQLVKQFKPLKFEELANPNNAEDFKLHTRHYLILSIEETLKLAVNNRLGLCKNNDFIYLYNGTFWAEIDKETFQKFLGAAALKMSVPKFSAEFYQFKEHLFKQFLSTAYLPTPAIDKNTVLINLQNGTFEISSQGTKLRPFDRKDFITYQLPFEYNPEAKAPIFQAYLDRVLPDVERQRVLAEYLGYVFIKHGSKVLKEEKALILYGGGSNGKGVFYEVVNALLGAENISSYSLQSVTDESGYFRAKLANKLVNYASEINTKLESSRFKRMVSGETVDARLPYGQPFNMEQYAKFIFNCNKLPTDVEHTNAYFRRFLIIPFDVTISESEKNTNLHNEIIDAELSGVFNWVLDGLNRLLTQKRFSECEAARKAVEEYKIDSDSVQMFLLDHDYKPSSIMSTSLKVMYPEYVQYCKDSGLFPVSIKLISDRIRSCGITVVRKTNGNEVFAVK